MTTHRPAKQWTTGEGLRTVAGPEPESVAAPPASGDGPPHRCHYPDLFGLVREAPAWLVWVWDWNEWRCWGGAEKRAAAERLAGRVAGNRPATVRRRGQAPVERPAEADALDLVDLQGRQGKPDVAYGPRLAGLTTGRG